MGQKTVIALSGCLLVLGLAAIVSADESVHTEPTQVSATCASTSALVSWAAVSDSHLSGYDVYRKESSGSEYSKANSYLVSTTQFTVTGLTSGIGYDFGVVSRYNDGHSSAMSVPATCITG